MPCRVKGSLLQDSLWAAKCEGCIGAHKFNPKKLNVQPRALRDFLGLEDHKQLCIALHQLPTCPVGLWYRTDELAQPRGEIVAVYACEDGTYRMSPLDYTGTLLRDVTLMQTDLVSCGCAFPAPHHTLSFCFHTTPIVRAQTVCKAQCIIRIRELLWLNTARFHESSLCSLPASYNRAPVG